MKFKTQASGHYTQDIVNGLVDKANMGTAILQVCSSLLSRGIEQARVAVLSTVASISQLDLADRLQAQREMLTFCAVTLSVGETRAPYPALCQVKWVQHKMVGPLR